MSAKKSAKTKSEPATATPSEAKVSKSVEKKPKKASALDAAARVLGEAKEPMNCQEIIKVMADKGYWTSPGGQTPWATLYSAMLRGAPAVGDCPNQPHSRSTTYVSGSRR